MTLEEMIIAVPTTTEAKIAYLESEIGEVWKKIASQQEEIAFLKRKLKRKYLKDTEYLDQIFDELAFGRVGLTLKELSYRIGRSKTTLKRLMPQIRNDERFRIEHDKGDPQKVILCLKKWK